MQLLVLFLTLIITCCNSVGQKVSKGGYSKSLFCVYASWSQSRREDCRFITDNIDTNLCTHLVYAFARVSKNELLATKPETELDRYSKKGKLLQKGNFRKFNDLKSQNPKVKTILSVGGNEHGSTAFSDMAFKAEGRQAFVRSAIKLLRDYDFDGLDINWQYPTFNGGRKSDKKNFPLLLQELQQAFQQEKLPAGKERLLLSITVAQSSFYIDGAYDIPALAPYPDFVNLLSFNYHGALWDSSIGHNAPLYPRKDQNEVSQKLNVAWSVDRWSSDVPTEKLLVGVATFGNTYTLTSPDKYNIGDPILTYGKAGPCSKQSGLLSYNEICRLFSNDKWTMERNEMQKVPYAYKNITWIGYDDVESVKDKANFVIENNLAGIFVWTLDFDDFRGLCGDGSYPIITAISQSFKIGGSSQTNSNTFKQNCASSKGTECSVPLKCITLDKKYFTKPELNCPPGNKCTFPQTEVCNLQMNAQQLGQSFVVKDDKSCSSSLECGKATYLPNKETNCPNTRCLPDDLGAFNMYSYLCPDNYIFSPALRSCFMGSKLDVYDNIPEATTPREFKPRGEYPFSCKEEGFFPNPLFCEKFYRCVLSEKEILKQYEFSCPIGLVFDTERDRCETREDVTECSL